MTIGYETERPSHRGRKAAAAVALVGASAAAFYFWPRGAHPLVQSPPRHVVIDPGPTVEASFGTENNGTEVNEKLSFNRLGAAILRQTDAGYTPVTNFEYGKVRPTLSELDCPEASDIPRIVVRASFIDNFQVNQSLRLTTNESCQPGDPALASLTSLTVQGQQYTVVPSSQSSASS